MSVITLFCCHGIILFPAFIMHTIKYDRYYWYFPHFFLVLYYSYIVFNSIEWHFPPQSGSCISYKLTFYHFSITVSSSVFISLVLRIWKSKTYKYARVLRARVLSLHKKNMITSFFRTVQRISGWKSNEILKYQNFFQKNVTKHVSN